MNTKESMSIWRQPLPAQLLKALFGLVESDDFAAFLRDVLTEKEITEISARLEAARLLSTGTSYVAIQEQTKLSTRTIARISRWVKEGERGYAAALKVITNSSQEALSHTLPVRAEH